MAKSARGANPENPANPVNPDSDKDAQSTAAFPRRGAPILAGMTKAQPAPLSPSSEMALVALWIPAFTGMTGEESEIGFGRAAIHAWFRARGYYKPLGG